MWIPADVLTALDQLAHLSDDGTSIVETMLQLINSVSIAVPAATRVAVTIQYGGQPVIVSTDSFQRSSFTILVRLPNAAPIESAVLAISVASRDAVAQLTADLRVLCGDFVGLSEQVDEPEPVDLAASLQDFSTVHKALGIFLDRGVTGETAMQELNRRAVDNGRSIATEAQAVLDSAVGRPNYPLLQPGESLQIEG